MNSTKPHFSLFPLILLVFGLLLACNNETTHSKENPVSAQSDTLAIYFINDQHGQLNNFAKIKHIVGAERATNEHVLLACAGDIFSGNPIVDQYEQKGYPMIDVMNQTGFDISVLGNHEFDYGPETLKARMNQAEFEWICANVDMRTSGVPQPNAFKTLHVGNLKVTFLGLVETFGKPGSIIPATHPWRVAKMSFQRHTAILSDYETLKADESADVVIALTHLGSSGDFDIAENYPYFDAVIGGHSHQYIDEEVNGIPVVQAGSYLSWLGRLQLVIEDGKIIDKSTSFVDLRTYEPTDQSLKNAIDQYNDAPQFDQIVGYAPSYQDRTELGCFYTTAIKESLNVDVSFQNGGGIRADIDQGDITSLEIFRMDPFNNQSVIFTLTAQEISNFLVGSGAGLHMTGLDAEFDGQQVALYREGARLQPDDAVTIGINDYIPAVYEQYFPLEKAQILEMTTAETILSYLETIRDTVDYDDCNRYIRFN